MFFFQKMSLSILVASGATSCLFAALLTTIAKQRLQSKFSFFAPTRKESNPQIVEALQKLGIVFLDEEMLKQIKFERTLWLSTHTDTTILAQQAKLMPTLAINSAAILDILYGKQASGSASAYQKEKLDMYHVSLLYNFIPGFFIQDVERQPWQSKGLHGDTTEKIFAAPFVDVSLDAWWQKAYCVTPLSFATASIINWLFKPHMFDKTMILCSRRPYRRFELRNFAGLPLTEELKQQQSLPVLYKDVPIDDEQVVKACKIAR